MTSENSSLLSNRDEVNEWSFDDDVQRKIVGTGLLIVCVLGTIGNMMVIIAVSLTKKLQNVTNVFVTNLAVVDLLHCVILPFMVHDLYQELLLLKPGPVRCITEGALTVLFLSVSVFSHALIAVTRYVMITQPRRACQTLFTSSRIAIIIIIIWVVSSIDPILSMAGVAPLGYNPKYGICSRDIRYSSSVILSSVRSVYTNLFSVVVVLYCYTKIFIYVRRHNQSALRRILTSSSASDSMASRKTLDENTGDIDSKNVKCMYVKQQDDDACVIKIEGTPHYVNDSSKTNNGPSNGIEKPALEGDMQRPPFTLTDENTMQCQTIVGKSAFGEDSGAAVAPVDDCFTSSLSYQEAVPKSPCPILLKSDKSVSYVLHSDSKEGFSDETYTQVNPDDKSDNSPCDNKPKQNRPNSVLRSCSFKDEVVSNRNNISYSFASSDGKRDHNDNKSEGSWRWRSQKSKERAANKKKEIDITKKLFIVVCVFFACISPYIFFVSIKSLERLLPYSALLLASSSCLNPIIYALSHPQFQKVFVLMVSCQLYKIPRKTRLLKILVRKESKSRSVVVI